MKPSQIQLDHFGLTRLEMQWHHACPEGVRPTRAFQVSYQVGRNDPVNPTRYRLVLNVEDGEAAPAGDPLYQLRVTIMGFFTVQGEPPVEERERMIRLNGLTVLWGTLRGALTTISGTFPPGFRYNLPTINVLELVQETEAKQARERAGKAAPKPPRAKPPKPKSP